METTDTAAEAPAPAEDDGFEWMIVEVFGHRRHGGRVREEERFGAKVMRIDVPTIVLEPYERDKPPVVKETTWVSHWYGGASLFSFVLTDEATVMRMNRRHAEPQRYIAPPERADYDEYEGQRDGE